MISPASLRGRLAWLALVLVVYVLAGAFGLEFAHVDDRVSLVWAPTGLAMAALVLVGRWTWPAVWLGALLVNATTSVPVWVAAVLATGNALEALAGEWLLRRLAFHPAVDRARDAVSFLAVVVPLAPMTSATMGVLGLWAAGAVEPGAGPTLWRVWYVGDVLGALIVFPPLVCWASGPWTTPSPRRLAEGLALVGLAALVGALAFGRWGFETHGYPPESLPLPLVVWAALRTGPRGVTVVSLVLALAAGVATVARGGSFDAQAVHEGVALVWTFVAITAGTGLLLGAATTERQAALREQERAAQALRAVVEGTASLTGEDLQGSLPRHLAAALGAPHVVLAELTAEGWLRVQARWPPAPAPAAEPALPLTGTAAGEVVTRGVLALERGARDRFPGDPLLAATQAEGCLGAPLLGASGRAQGVVLVTSARPLVVDALARDLVTVCASRAAAELERARHEQERQRLETQMWHAQKLESIGVLAGGVAHDFNNLLVGVLGNASRLQTELPPGAPTHAIAKRIETAGRRAAELTQQLLAYAGRGHLTLAPIDLSALVEEMVELMDATISKKIDLRRELAADLPRVQGDATQVRQVVMNLLTNASDAIGEASGRIVVRTGLCETGPGELAETVGAPDLPAGSYPFVEVRDSGRGMSPATAARMFEPFFTTKVSGRGLGLAATLGIIRAHRGAVFVESAPGAGTTLRVLLPAAAEQPPPTRPMDEEAAAPAPAPDAAGVARGLILVVDDEPTVRDVATAALGDAGHPVLVAVDGQEAVDVFAARGPELAAVLLDLNMPRLNGHEVLARLRQARPHLPVVVMSGHPTAALDPADRRLTFLPKPFTPSELLRALDLVATPAP